MSKQKQSHIERTANEPRDEVGFLPGQWVDLYPPPHTGIKKPGGFTITSSPSLAVARRPPAATHRHSPDDEAQPEPTTAASPSPAYLELAIQSSPTNPPAAYLFQPAAELLRNEVRVRIGGSFVFPPPAAALAPPPLRKAVFVAGGMGINPLMSMLSFIGEQRDRWAGLEVRVLYSVRDPRHASEILFLERIVGLFESGSVKGGLRLFLTGGTAPSSVQDGNTRGEKDVVRCNNGAKVPFLRRRMSVSDVEQAVGEDKEAAVVYICGVPLMTDQFVEALVSPAGLGMQQKRVLFEKWW
ncbi:uncharacterized protein THITE_2038515 [Thermothielavioides terrestris NRRL 8126]|uniref:Oxidoreductase FAD/NAD(P)-binding domain-containing protein n=1 Tax=Thermothielavioides terrestris (strain ATCC 38088 / NRRL 8126) TaxID=578455 RepID=G2QTB8_THETT|nr:uncharacterized protein THITE_2038515 [Thermothielavioides terrestris NRRL 8126]AEO62735.1 hypothetical protein THITE_2038515 [Thermothielavioides terrestris NRRL 8126]